MKIANKRESAKSRSLSAALKRLKTVWTDWQVFLASLFVVAFLLLQVAPVRELVSRLPIDPEWLSLSLLLPALLLVILWQLVEITGRLDAVESGRRPIANSNDVPTLVLQALSRSHSKRLDVVGITLRYGWVDVRRWIDSGHLRGWTVQLSAFTGEGAGVPASWAQDSLHYLTDIHNFSNKTGFASKNVNLAAFEYKHPPVLHGYRLGNGDVWMAVVHWNKSGSAMRGAPHQYEYVPSEDVSEEAARKRALFESWMKASQSNKFVPEASAPSK